MTEAEIVKARSLGPYRSETALDAMDWALTERLRSDGRENNRSLAAALGISETTVANRLRRLERAGIMRVVALTDIEAFGYTLLAFGKIRVAGRAPLEVAAEVGSIPQVLSAAVVTGRFDLIVSVLARSRGEIDQLFGSKIALVPGVEMARCELSLATLRFESMWAALAAGEPPDDVMHTDCEAVDGMDRSIITLLQRDARASNRSLASEVGVSEATIRARIRRMQDEDIIRIQAVSDVVAFGLRAHAYVGIHVRSRSVEEVAPALLTCDGVAVLVRTLGDFDLLAVVAASSTDELAAIVLDQIRAVPGVHRTETFEIWRTVKHAYTWARLGGAIG